MSQEMGNASRPSSSRPERMSAVLIQFVSLVVFIKCGARKIQCRYQAAAHSYEKFRARQKPLSAAQNFSDNGREPRTSRLTFNGVFPPVGGCCPKLEALSSRKGRSFRH